jgi:hypothetical protein
MVLNREPTLGNEAEVRRLMQELVGLVQSRGHAVALEQQLLGPRGRPFRTILRNDSLADVEAILKGLGTSPDYQQLVARINPLFARPTTMQLLESIGPRVAIPATHRYTLRNLISPIPSREKDVRVALEEWVQTRHAAGRPQNGLARQLFAPEGTVFVHTARYADLAEYERFTLREVPEETRTLVAKVTPLLLAPARSGLYEVLVPFNR